jgi:NAD(P)-dependent dehydrogenase (short-subunit alcohol dehydrogenase family)
VALAARTSSHLEQLRQQIEEAGGLALSIVTDVSDVEQARAAAQITADRFGRIDILVHNARARVRYQAFVDDDLASWEASFKVNVLGAIAMTQQVVPHMKAGGGGSIVFIGTMLTRKPLATMGAYASTKGALLTLARTLAVELGPANIRVNTVVPGWMLSPSLEQWFASAGAAKDSGAANERAAAESRTALGRLPTAADCADAVLFFASDMSSAITGQTLDVNAGEVFI